MSTAPQASSGEQRSGQRDSNIDWDVSRLCQERLPRGLRADRAICEYGELLATVEYRPLADLMLISGGRLQSFLARGKRRPWRNEVLHLMTALIASSKAPLGIKRPADGPHEPPVGGCVCALIDDGATSPRARTLARPRHTPIDMAIRLSRSMFAGRRLSCSSLPPGLRHGNQNDSATRKWRS
jgi:hypothetical protein